MELNAEGNSHARAKLPSKDYEVLAKLEKVLTLELLTKDYYRESVLSNSLQETARELRFKHFLLQRF